MVKGAASALVCKHLTIPLVDDYMCVPMVAQGEIIGLFHLQAPPNRSREYLMEVDQHLAVTVAKQVSMSLANLGLRESLYNQAIVDPLTGLFNRRYMEESFEREMCTGRNVWKRPYGLS